MIVSMKRNLFLLVAMFMAFALHGDEVEAQFNGKPGSVTGWLRDVACVVRNQAATKPQGDCALQCLRLGSPMVIVTKDGQLHFPISTQIHDVDQRKRLMPFAAKYVTVSGRVFERSGVHAIAVEKIVEAPEPK